MAVRPPSAHPSSTQRINPTKKAHRDRPAEPTSGRQEPETPVQPGVAEYSHEKQPHLDQRLLAQGD